MCRNAEREKEEFSHELESLIERLKVYAEDEDDIQDTYDPSRFVWKVGISS